MASSRSPADPAAEEDLVPGSLKWAERQMEINIPKIGARKIIDPPPPTAEKRREYKVFELKSLIEGFGKDGMTLIKPLPDTYKASMEVALRAWENKGVDWVDGQAYLWSPKECLRKVALKRWRASTMSTHLTTSWTTTSIALMFRPENTSVASTTNCGKLVRWTFELLAIRYVLCWQALGSNTNPNNAIALPFLYDTGAEVPLILEADALALNLREKAKLCAASLVVLRSSDLTLRPPSFSVIPMVLSVPNRQDGSIM
ncbi:hypothetical protein Dda_3805 [Drechslerella dactyloides]|uniref:Uncharacterized protein n=1 Tax=Drechslerella dactyloides TaxID=74499 RepID=A0AAD6J046_DREDA|nr:hypothetical protein Dda_3805 [Drechslerella dactyloides]